MSARRPVPLKYRVGPADGHGIFGQGQVLLRENLQVRGVRSGCARRAARAGRSSRPCRSAALPRPCRRPRPCLRSRQPAAAVLVREGEPRQRHGQALAAAGRAPGAAPRTEKDSLPSSSSVVSSKFSQDVVRARRAPAPAARGCGRNCQTARPARRRRRPSRVAAAAAAPPHGAPNRREQRSVAQAARVEDQVAELARGAVAAALVGDPVHACRAPRHGALAGATARPTCGNTPRSARSSPM